MCKTKLMNMKNLIKINKYIITLFWFGLNCSILKAEVVITELFILQDHNTHTPQYIELYNNSDETISVENWAITTIDNSGSIILKSSIDNSGLYVQANNFEIDPFGYFLISSSSCSYSTSGCYFYREKQSDIIAWYLIFPFELQIDDPEWNFIDKGSIILTNDNEVEEDRIEYDIATGWPVGEESRGHSLRLHVAPSSVNNDDPDNWSLSPVTEKSIWLYDEGEEIRSFGSPREENSFRLKGDEGFIHIISGDVNNIYNASNNYENNNFSNSIDFSWYGTFYNVADQQYTLIIEKLGAKKPQKHGFEPILYPDLDTLTWENIIGIDTSISPQSLLIDQLEVADYSWTLELTKGSDTIYSDLHYFSIDASDYGYYGCIDESSCKIGSSGYPTCPTTAADDTLISNHPFECTPGVDCYKAINFDENANINSNTCHYVSLSIPAFVVGDTNTIATLPIYFKNDSLSEINEIEF